MDGIGTISNNYIDSRLDTMNKTVSKKQNLRPNEEENNSNVDKAESENKDHKKMLEEAKVEFKDAAKYNRRFEYSIHDKTNRIMIKVINTNNDQVIKEIPAEKMLDMVASMCEWAGLFLDEKR